MTEAEDQQGAPIGHVYGFWRLAGPLPGNPNWDTAWSPESRAEFEHAPERDIARQHGGRSGEVEEVSDNRDSESPRVDAEGHFPYPARSLPTPIIQFDFRIAVRFAPSTTETVAKDGKTVELARGACGSWSGTLGSGIVVSGAHDLDRTKLKTRVIHKVITAFKLQTHEEEPANLGMETRGFLRGPPDVLHPTAHRSDDEARIDPGYHYRMFINLATADERYVEKVRGALWMGTGVWDLDELVIDAYRVG